MYEITSLFRQYKKYDSISDAELRLYLMPSIKLKQYKIHYEGDEVIGFTNWAFLSDEAQKRFKQEGYLKPSDWRSGNHIWHIETICKRNLKKIMQWTKRHFAKMYGAGKAINWLRVDNDETIRTVMKVHTKESWI